jgi:hypothetical protein
MSAVLASIKRFRKASAANAPTIHEKNNGSITNTLVCSIKMSILQLKGVHGCQIQNVNIHVNGSERDGRIIKRLFPIFPLVRIAINRSFHIGYARFVGFTRENRS